MRGIIGKKKYALESYSKAFQDGSRHATLVLIGNNRGQKRSYPAEFDLEAVKRWTDGRVSNYGRNDTLNALQDQIRVWQGTPTNNERKNGGV